MSEPTTGATPEQIEDAARAWFEDDKRRRGWLHTWDVVNQSGRIERIAVVATYLVKPDHRIVKATAVPDAELRAAMKVDKQDLTDAEIKTIVYAIKDATTAMWVGTSADWYASCREAIDASFAKLGLTITRTDRHLAAGEARTEEGG